MVSSSPKHFLVTAGNTREKIDEVRDWGNIFTGDTGFNIARALAGFGSVDLLTSNQKHLAEVRGGLGTSFEVQASGFDSHESLRGALTTIMARQKYDAVFMTAAVADYRPVRVYSVLHREPAKQGEKGEETWRVVDVQAGKVKSNHREIAVLGQQTEKLIDKFRGEWNHRGLLFKFKLEVGASREELIRIGQASRVASGAQYLIANTLEMVRGSNPGALILSEQGQEWVARAALAMRLAELAVSGVS